MEAMPLIRQIRQVAALAGLHLLERFCPRQGARAAHLVEIILLCKWPCPRLMSQQHTQMGQILGQELNIISLNLEQEPLHMLVAEVRSFHLARAEEAGRALRLIMIRFRVIRAALPAVEAAVAPMRQTPKVSMEQKAATVATALYSSFVRLFERSGTA